MKSYAIILGGGSGRRMEADRNKVFLPLRGIPAIVRAIAPFSALCAGAVVVAAAAEVEEMRAVIARCGLDRFVMRVVPGGAERQDSVRCGLDALPADAECVLIHDGARALVWGRTTPLCWSMRACRSTCARAAAKTSSSPLPPTSCSPG